MIEMAITATAATRAAEDFRVASIFRPAIRGSREHHADLVNELPRLAPAGGIGNISDGSDRLDLDDTGDRSN